MDDKTSLVATTLAVIILIPILSVVGYLVLDQLRARRNRLYKTLAEHEILNNAGDRDVWMSGVVPQGGEQQVDRFSSRIVPIAQLVMLVVLAAVVLVWNESLVKQTAEQNERMAQLELQLHALSFATPVASGAPREADPAPGAAPAAVVNPMQQACANLIGRVADAYEKAESSKIALSLEQLVNKLGCKNNPVP
jgi:hypothetical protein